MADVISFAPQHEEDLSDEQMQEMLAQAAKRRQENASVALADDEAKSNRFNFPKLNTGEMVQPYVSNKGDVAKVDSSRLLAQQDRKLSNQIRKVEDPVAVKKQMLEVRTLITLHPPFTPLAYEENYPNFFLTRSRGTVLVPFCTTEVFLFIVTLRHFHKHIRFEQLSEGDLANSFSSSLRKPRPANSGSTCLAPISHPS